MFNIGRKYKIRVSLGGDEQIWYSCTVVDEQGPVIKIVDDAGEEHILNTSAPAFIEAEPQE